VEAFDLYWSSFPRNLQNHTCGIVSLALRVTTDSFSRDSRHINYGTAVHYALSSCAARDLASGLDGRGDQPPHDFYPNQARTLPPVPDLEARSITSPAPVITALP